MSRASLSASTVLRKPWGGALESARTTEPPLQRLDVMDWIAIGSRKFAELLLLTTILAVPLVYHYSLYPEAYTAIRNMVVAGLDPIFGKPAVEGEPSFAAFFFDTEIAPFLTGLLPTLSMKFSTWLIPGMLMIACLMIVKLMEATTGRQFMASIEGIGSIGRRPLHRIIPLIGIGLFLLLSLASFLFWAPSTPPDAQAALAAQTEQARSWADRLGGGGFLYSAIAWLQITFALFFYLCCEDLIRTRAYVNKIFSVLIFTGVLNALVVVLLKVGFGPLEAVWIKFGESDHRNNLGAFIGHNTGVSSFLMAPFLICIAWLLGVHPRPRPWLRPALGVIVLLMALALVLCQSRAVIPILAVCTGFLILMLYRRSCLAPVSRTMIFLALGMGLVLATQLVRTPGNVLYRQDMELADRVSQFRYSHLRTETRLRIFWIAVTQIIPERPLIGHGWASFQYVYPVAAGRFFSQYPETELAPTPLRTPQAHNEYLQLVVENGFLGLLIVLAALFFLMRGGWIVLRRTIMPYHMTIQVAIYLSIMALLAHCLFDFPLRVPPLAMSLVVLLAIWSAGDRLWLFPLRAPAEEDPLIMERDDRRRSIEAPVAAVRAPRIPLLAWLVLPAGVTLLLAATWVGVRSASSLMTVGVSINRCYALHDMFIRSRDRYWLEETLRTADNARRVFWINGDAAMIRARAMYFKGVLFIDFAQRSHAEGNSELAAQTMQLAHTYLQDALSDVRLSLAEHRHNGQYQLRSLIYDALSRTVGGEDSRFYRRLALEDLQEAVAINPGEPESLLDLIRALELAPEVNRQELVRHMRTLNYFHPSVFRDRIYARMLDSYSVHDMFEARRMVDILNECIAPGFRRMDRGTLILEGEGERPATSLPARRLRRLAADDDLRIAEATILAGEGRNEQAWELAEAYIRWHDNVLVPRRNAFPREQWEEIRALHGAAHMIQLYDLIARRTNIPQIERRLRTQEAMLPEGDVHIPVLRYLLQRIRGIRASDRTTEDLHAELVARAMRAPYVAVVVSDLAERLFGDDEVALEWMEIRRRRSGHAYSEQEAARWEVEDSQLTDVAEYPTVPMDAVELAAITRLLRKTERAEELRSWLPELENVRATPRLMNFLQRQHAEYTAWLNSR